MSEAPAIPGPPTATLLCAACLLMGVDAVAVTQVEGTVLCRSHGSLLASTGRTQMMLTRMAMAGP